MEDPNRPPPYSTYDSQKPVTDGYGYGYGYPQAPFGHSAAQGHSQPMQPIQQQPPQQLQQQQMIVVGSLATAAPEVFYNPYPVRMTGALVLSCVVFWCFGWLFGGIAFILAVIGNDSSNRGDVTSAIRLRNASYGMSVAGILIACIAIGVIIWFYTSCSYPTNSRHGRCNGLW